MDVLITFLKLWSEEYHEQPAHIWDTEVSEQDSKERQVLVSSFTEEATYWKQMKMNEDDMPVEEEIEKKQEPYSPSKHKV